MVTIPDSVTSIDNSAFYGCSGLTYIKIPKSVTDVGWYVFSYCSNLTAIYCEAESKPDGWDEDWQGIQDRKTGAKAEVHWGSTGPETIHGNFNDDSEVDMKDAAHFIGWVGAPFLPQFQINQSFDADFNKDGSIDMSTVPSSVQNRLVKENKYEKY